METTPRGELGLKPVLKRHECRSEKVAILALGFICSLAPESENVSGREDSLTKANGTKKCTRGACAHRVSWRWEAPKRNGLGVNLAPTRA